MQAIIDHFTAHQPEYAEITTDRLIATGLPTYTELGRDQILARIMIPGFQAFAQELVQQIDGAFGSYFGRVGTLRAQQNGRIEDVLVALQTAKEVMNADMSASFRDQPEALIWWYEHMIPIIYNGAIAVSRNFVAAREQIIQSQATELREMAMAIIPIYQNVLVLPLVGSMSPQRASMLIEVLLGGISRHGAEVVIIDITAVPVIDTSVANYLIQAARAASLLGSQIILVGISPEIAQTLVQLGVDLSSVITRADLQSGVEHALRLRHREIVATR